MCVPIIVLSRSPYAQHITSTYYKSLRTVRSYYAMHDMVYSHFILRNNVELSRFTHQASLAKQLVEVHT